MRILCRKYTIHALKEKEMEQASDMAYQQINADTIDKWVSEGWEWGRPVSHETYLAAQNGQWNVLLTPTKPVPHAWFGDLKNKRILGLASGGGQQMPIFAALGAKVTVLDYSPRQLESEKMCSERDGYDIEIIRADMTRPLPFADESFDLVFHPVSNVYIRSVQPVWNECFRILKKGGVLLAGLDNGINFVFDEKEEYVTNTLPFDPVNNTDQLRQLQEQDCGVQFSHTADEQLEGQLKAGFEITDIYEDTNGTGNLHEHNVPTFWATRAVRKQQSRDSGNTDYAALCEELDVISQDVRYPESILANAAALIWDNLTGINWCGFYLMRDGQLALGSFQGKIACTEISLGKGVCGTAAVRNETVLVGNVHTFDGHIACDSASNSEIVVPVHKDGRLYGVLDIDSPLYARFTADDRTGLEQVVRTLEKHI